MLNIHDRDLDILARTIYGEARGELNQPSSGMKSLHAVGWVVRNRAKNPQFGTQIHRICMQPWQFSCWNVNDPNREQLLLANFKCKVFQNCYLAATCVLFDKAEDCTKGATHYHASNIALPHWAAGQTPTITIGNHIFYKL